MVLIETKVEPDPLNARVYDELFDRYLELYSRLNS